MFRLARNVSIWNASGWNQNWPFERLHYVATAKRGILVKGFLLYGSIYRKTNHALISEIPRGLVRPMTMIGRRREQRKYDIPRVSRYHRTVCKQLFSFFRLLSISGIPGQVRVLSIAVLWTSFPVKLNFLRSPRMIFISLSLSFSLLLVQLHGKEIESSGIVFSLKVKRPRGEWV